MANQKESSKAAFLVVRFSPSDKAEVAAAANAAGARDVSTWVRKVLLAAARRWTAPAAE
jgi:hypothetical protein